MQLTSEQIRHYFEHSHPDQRIPARAKASVKCLFHDDRTPSCTLFLDGNGGFHCNGCNAGGNMFQHAAKLYDCSISEAEAKIAEITGARAVGYQNLGAVVACYDYRDANGLVLYQKRRYQPEGQPKTFRVYRKTDDGGWATGIDAKDGEPTKRVLYRLPQLVTANVVLLAEGEKDCDNLTALGLWTDHPQWRVAATCNFDGAWQPGQSKWLPQYTPYFAGKLCAIFADNDTSGETWATTIAKEIHSVAELVKIVRLPDLPEHGDVSDWLAQGHSGADLGERIKKAPAYLPEKPDRATPDSNGYTLVSIGELLSRPDEPVDWLLDGRLVSGTVSMIAAKPKVGKSTFARNLALAVSRGECFLGVATKQGEVIYLALEERAEEVKSDFKSLGATGTEPILIHADSSPAAGIGSLVALVEQHKPRLVVIDPLFRITRIRDERAYAEVYAALGPLIDVSRRVGTHILLTHHSGKSEKADAIDSPLGSTALGGAVSTLVCLKRTKDYRTIQTVQRVGEDLPDTVLSFDSKTRRLNLGGSRKDTDIEDAEKKILEFLDGSAEQRTRDQFEEALEVRAGIIRAALDALVNDGVIQRAGGGKKGDPFLFFLSQPIPGTGGQESENGPRTRMNIERIPVPENQGNATFRANPGTGILPVQELVLSGSREALSEVDL